MCIMRGLSKGRLKGNLLFLPPERLSLILRSGNVSWLCKDLEKNV